MDAASEAAHTAEAWAPRHLAAIYLVLALLLTGFLFVLTPPFDVADEGNHARRALEISHGQLIAQKTAEGVGAAEDSGFLAVIDAMDHLRVDLAARYSEGTRLPDGRVTQPELAPLKGVRWSGHQAFTRFANTAVYPPGFYLPEAAGWAIARAANLTIVRSLMLARLCTAWCAIALGWLALRLCPGGRWVLFAYLLLPTVLSLQASCSQDGLLLAVAGLFSVLVCRAVALRHALTAKELFAAAWLLALCSGARPTYLPLVLVLALPALEAPMTSRRRLTGPALAMAFVVALNAAWVLAVRSLGTAIAPWADPAQQAALLRAHPLHAVLSLCDALLKVIPAMMLKGLYMLGFNDAGPSHATYAVMGLGLAGVIVLDATVPLRTRAAKVVLLVALFGVVAGTWLAEYLVWTPPGATRVMGLQSRYFLPLIPLTFLLLAPALRWLRLKMMGESSLQGRWLIASASVYALGVLTIPFVAARVFYLSGVSHALRLLLG